MYYTVIKRDGHLRTQRKCRKYELQAIIFFISRVFSNARQVLLQCNTRLRLLYFLIRLDRFCTFSHFSGTTGFFATNSPMVQKV